jgi:hypothetical protein
VAEQGWKVDKMLDLVHVNHICIGYFLIYISQQVSAWISQSANDLPAPGLARPLFLKLYPSSTNNSRSTKEESVIARIDCHVSIV